MFRKFRVLLDARQRQRAVLVLIGMSISAGLEMIGIGAIPAFVGLLVNPRRLLAALPESGLSTSVRAIELPTLTLLAAGALLMLFLIKNLYAAGILFVGARLMQNVRISVSKRLFKAYLYSPYTFHLQRNPAELISTLGGETNRAVQVVDGSMRVMREGLMLAVAFALLLWLDPLVSLATFSLMAAASGAFYFTIRKSMRRRGQLLQDHWARLTQVVNQGLGAIKEAKILGREQHLAGLFGVESLGIGRQEMFQQVAGALPRLFLEVMAVVAMLCVTVAFVWLGRPVQAMLPVLALLAVVSVRLVPSLTVINASLAATRYNRPALDLVTSELVSLEKTGAPAHLAVAPATTGSNLRKSVVMHDVHYGYPGASSPALHGISLEIRAGEAVGFIGPSGAGKSTLIDVILGLLIPAAGEVRVDGRDIQENIAEWQRQIGYVPQEIYLLDDTIRRNIAFGLPDDQINEEALARATAAAQIDQFVRTLPGGLDTVIGNWGIRLSGGQRQRIGIARALYNNPAVLVLDEATSSLDSETEREVITAINRLRGDRTIIMIAHRLTTVQGCGQIYLLENGRISDEGKMEELAQRHPHLRQTIRPLEPAVDDERDAR